MRHEHGVTGRDGRQEVDRAVGGAVDVLIGEPGAGRAVGDHVVVDLLELGLALSDLVVFVRRIRAPVATRRQHLHRDQAISLEAARRGEVAHLARAGARPAKLHRDVARRRVADRIARFGTGGSDSFF